MDKKFKIPAEKIRLIIPLGNGCVASDKIVFDGLPIGYMYREESNFEMDSGWRFFSGTESQEYVDNAQNLSIYELNTIVNYDQQILPYLDLPINTELERKDDIFKVIE